MSSNALLSALLYPMRMSVSQKADRVTTWWGFANIKEQKLSALSAWNAKLSHAYKCKYSHRSFMLKKF